MSNMAYLFTKHLSLNKQLTCSALKHFKYPAIMHLNSHNPVANSLKLTEYRHGYNLSPLAVNSDRFGGSKSYRWMILSVAAVLASFTTVSLIEDNTVRDLQQHFTKEIAKLKNQFGQMALYPQVKVQLRGPTYTIQFEVDQRKCDLFQIWTLFFSFYAQQKTFKITQDKAYLTEQGLLTHFVEFEQQDPVFKTPQKGRITITGIRSNENSTFRVIFEKSDSVSKKSVQALTACYREAVRPKEQFKTQTKQGQTIKGVQRQNQPTSDKYKKLQEFGVTVFDPNNKTLNLDWDYLAGYQAQKRSIEDTVLLALNYPQVYDEITEQTRVKYQPNRPKAVLFQGPPGTGKTTSAKIISQQVKVPLIYMPIEAVMSKFYGESEKKLADLWEACRQLGKVIIFIDEIDALAGSRNSDMHEASRRVLSTLLRKIDSFESTTDVLLICATNRKQDLDPAMLSRIDLSIKFALPDRQSRAAIFARYARQLSQEEREKLASKTQGFSGRNISDICKRKGQRRTGIEGISFIRKYISFCL